MKAYFPKLDSIRFYAFLLVFISHIYVFCYYAGDDTSMWFLENGPKIFAHGEMGVHIFFALSGFLIMLLAIREFRNKNSFSVLGFFKRRILRIWPLYFLGLTAGMLIAAGSTNDPTCVQRFWYFLGNTCMAEGYAQNDLMALVGPLWSVSVEEQFYLTFPFVFGLGLLSIKRWGKKAGYVIGLAALSALTISLYRRYVYSGDWNYISYATLSQLPSLFLGMGLAMFVSVEKWKAKISLYVSKYKRSLTVIAAASFFISVYLKFTGALGVSIYVLNLFVATMVMILLSIYGVDEPEGSVTKMQKTSRYLGRISYGLYVYHMFAIVGVKHAFHYLGISSGTLSVLYVQAVIILALTILLAHLSYQYIEKFFLRYK